MRLIDADELKKCAIPCEIHNGALTELCVPLYQIDNAPTVTNGTYEQGFRVGAYGRLDEIRPHGEWNYIQAGMCVCPFCGAIPHKLYKDFCAKCGAEMKTSNSVK